MRLLGITIDRKLTWKKHLKELKMGMSREAAGYYYRPKTHLEETSKGIKEQLCL